MVTGGRNMGRVGVVTHRERHDGGFNIVHIKDAIDNTFATRESNVFVIGSDKPWISLPKGKGVQVEQSPAAELELKADTGFSSYRLPRRGTVVVRMLWRVVESHRNAKPSSFARKCGLCANGRELNARLSVLVAIVHRAKYQIKVFRFRTSSVRALTNAVK